MLECAHSVHCLKLNKPWEYVEAKQQEPLCVKVHTWTPLESDGKMVVYNLTWLFNPLLVWMEHVLGEYLVYNIGLVDFKHLTLLYKSLLLLAEPSDALFKSAAHLGMLSG